MIGSIKRKFLPSIDTKISQAVNHGSVFLALQKNFFTHEKLLSWLVTEDVTPLTKIAYKAVCEKINPNNQYLDDDYHFLKKKPDYAPIAIGYGLNVNLIDMKNSSEDIPIILSITDVMDKYNKNSEDRKFCSLLLKGDGDKQYLKSKLILCYKSRVFPHLNITANEINEALVSSDWFDKFRYNDKLAKFIIERILNLQILPIYYAEVVCKSYRDVIVKLNKDKLFTQLTQKELSIIDSFFPGIIDRRILKYDELSYKISVLSNDIAGYVLGFPIQNMIPNDEQIHIAINYLSSYGMDKYAKFIRDYVESTYLPTSPFHSNKHIYSNDEDVMLEDPNDYVPFDIVSYRSGDHIFRFTRPEFPQLSKSKKNPWTNEWLPPTILSTIISRSQASKELGLPPSRPLIDMLNCIKSDTLFHSNDDPPINSPSRNIFNSPFIIDSGVLSSIDINWHPGLPIDNNDTEDEDEDDYEDDEDEVQYEDDLE